MLRGKLLLALQAVKRALALGGSSHPAVHRATVSLCKLVQVGAPVTGFICHTSAGCHNIGVDRQGRCLGCSFCSRLVHTAFNGRTQEYVRVDVDCSYQLGMRIL